METIITNNDWFNLQPARKALVMVWVTGMVCAAVVVVYIFQPSVAANRKLNHFNTSKENNESVRSIDDLLLSPADVVLADNKSFVNGALRFQWRNQEPNLNEGGNRTILYDNILRKKLQKLPHTTVPDFSIRPVPK